MVNEVSYERYMELKNSGKLKKCNAQAFEAVAKWPGHTGLWYAEKLRKNPFTFRPRLTDLRKAGLLAHKKKITEKFFRIESGTFFTHTGWAWELAPPADVVQGELGL